MNRTVEVRSPHATPGSSVVAIPVARIVTSTARQGTWEVFSELPTNRLVGSFATEQLALTAAEAYADSMIMLLQAMC